MVGEPCNAWQLCVLTNIKIDNKEGMVGVVAVIDR